MLYISLEKVVPEEKKPKEIVVNKTNPNSYKKERNEDRAEVFRKFNTFGIYIISLVVCGTMAYSLAAIV